MLTTEASSISRAQMMASQLVTRLGFTQDAVVIFVVKVLERFKLNNVALVRIHSDNISS